MTTTSSNARTIKTPSGKTITFNDQQLAALASMQEWLERPDDDLFFTLSGYAGTGKTTITLELIRWYREKWKRKDLCVSAPTHKAKKVIAGATGEESFTIQKLLGLRPNTDLEKFDINNPQFDELADKVICDYKLVIIDEASMLNEGLYTLLVQEAIEYKTKILFMGDAAQLPPVNESISKIFTDVTNWVQLTKVERQAGSNPLMSVYDLIRSNLRSQTDLFSHRDQVNDEGEGIIFYNNQNAFEAKVLPLFVCAEYKKNPDHVKLITYMNASVKVWNTQIRNHIFNRPKELIIKGDVLMAYNTVIGDFNDIIIENSSDYRVEAVSSLKSLGIDVYEVAVRSLDDNKRSLINIVKPSGVATFITIFNMRLNNAKYAKGVTRRAAWRSYYDFKNKHLLLEDVYHDGKFLVKKDIDYGYAITVHKSQGSTFTNVAISETNIDRNTNHEERNKLKYVAFSRPTKLAMVFTNKAE